MLEGFPDLRPRVLSSALKRSACSSLPKRVRKRLMTLRRSLGTSVPQNLASGSLKAGTQVIIPVGLIPLKIPRHVFKLSQERFQATRAVKRHKLNV